MKTMNGCKDGRTDSRKTDRQMDRHDEANICLSQFCEHTQNSNSNLIQLLGKSEESDSNIFFLYTMYSNNNIKKSIPAKIVNIKKQFYLF
jgi:hypothetical protein